MKYKIKFDSSILICALLILTTHQAEAETLSSGVEFNGYLDFYYQQSPQGHALNPSATSGPSVIEGRYFDRHSNQMTLNMAEVSFKKKSGNVSLKVDLAGGEMVDQLSGGPASVNESTRPITQATLTYAPTDQISFTAGKFYTHMGLEVTKAKDNWQYSRTYLYNYGIPFWHEGLSGTYIIEPGKLSASLYLLNAWDGRISQEQNKSKTVGANINWTGLEGVTANYNYIGGAEASDESRREAHELNLTYAFNPSLILAVDYLLGTQKNMTSVGQAQWTSLSLYLKAIINNLYSISPRYEFFDDSDQGFAIAGGLSAPGTQQKIKSFTVANNFNLGDGLEARLELRTDKSDSELFFKDKDGGTTDHQESCVAAFLYSF